MSVTNDQLYLPMTVALQQREEQRQIGAKHGTPHAILGLFGVLPWHCDSQCRTTVYKNTGSPESLVQTLGNSFKSCSINYLYELTKFIFQNKNMLYKSGGMDRSVFLNHLYNACEYMIFILHQSKIYKRFQNLSGIKQ